MLEQVNLTTLVPQHLLTWSDHIRARDLVFESANSKPCSIKGQSALLGELLNILLDNACKYSEPGTPIKIGLETLENAVFVKVEDKGCGIEPEIQDKMRALDVIPVGSSAEEFGRTIAKELTQWQDVAKAGNIKLQ